MKKFLFPLLAALAVPAFASDITLDNLTQKDVDNVTTEFAANFAHTAVAAPETDGAWGVEVGVIGGITGTPKLKGVINDAGGDGSDFKNVYHAGVMARVHFPMDVFVEGSFLPQKEISDVTVSSHSLGLGWNAGGYFGLPLDLAIGAQISSHDVEFKQTIQNASTSNVPVDSKINLNGSTRVFYVAASKTFLFITPYVKVGMAHQDSDIKVKGQGSIFNTTFTAGQKADADVNGGYFVAGANLQLAFFKLGFEWGQTMGVRRATGKISLDF
jgi:hypothetical protein